MELVQLIPPRVGSFFEKHEAILVKVGCFILGYAACQLVNRKKLVVSKLELERRRLIDELDRALTKSKSCLLELNANTNDMQLYLKQDTITSKL